MRKLKGQSRLTKLITSRLAKSNRKQFSGMIHDTQQLKNLAKRADNHQTTSLSLVSFSSSNDYPEQVLSILSFLRHVGTPPSWTVYSDGSHTSDEINNMQTALPFVSVINQHTDATYFEADTLKETLKPYKKELRDFAQKHFLGRRLSLYLNHSIDKPTLFLDSDILFYKQFSWLKTSFVNAGQGWFLPDEGWGCLDRRYKAVKAPERYQVNAGFFLSINELINVQDGLSFLRTAQPIYEYFTEQTIMHILLTSNMYRPLDPELFVVNTSDQFDFSYTYSPDKLAIRHYTGPVRHKMWQRDWRWQLSLT